MCLISAASFHTSTLLSLTLATIFIKHCAFYFLWSVLICGECLHVRDVTSHSAVLHWRPVLIEGSGWYELQYGGTEQSVIRQQNLILSSDDTRTVLTDLEPDTHYSVLLTAHTPHTPHSKSLSTSFTTLPGEEAFLLFCTFLCVSLQSASQCRGCDGC